MNQTETRVRTLLMLWIAAALVAHLAQFVPLIRPIFRSLGLIV
jgi:hypothetical protein